MDKIHVTAVRGFDRDPRPEDWCDNVDEPVEDVPTCPHDWDKCTTDCIFYTRKEVE